MSDDEGILAAPYVSPFESIRKINEDDSEYWFARDLARISSKMQFSVQRRYVSKADSQSKIIFSMWGN